MRAKKNRRSGLFFLSITALVLVLSSFFLFSLKSPAAYAANNGVNDCAQFVANDTGLTVDQVKAPNSEAKDFYKACTDAYNAMYKAYSEGQANATQQYNTICQKLLSSGDRLGASCQQGRNEGTKDGQADRNAPSGGSTSDTDLVAKAKADDACRPLSGARKEACIAGYVAGYKNVSRSSVCKDGGKITAAGTTYSVTNNNIADCINGYNAGDSEGIVVAPRLPPPEREPSADAKNACKAYSPGGAKENATVYSACLGGFNDGTDGKSQKEACDDKFPDGSKRLEGCLVGFKAATANNDDDTSACVANSSTTLEWIACPLITALSKGADKLNDLVEDQLNFKTSRFLPEDGDNNGAYKAWAIIKNLATSILIIVLLIMVFSQAIGNGFFEAYTIRKVLPRLVVAVIGMQLSWELCIFIINLINNIGEGLAQLITAPFGGVDRLDLPSLLNHLNGLVAAGTSVTLVAALVSSVFLSAIFLPGALLVAFSVLMTVLIGLASILFRNIIIIACVIFAPIALLMWVIPNSSTKKYWSLWSDNFTKVLLLFPIMVGIIYSGRIFAWIAGDLGATAGFLDLIMVLVGFFGPYAILPKAFKWGGSLMSSGANAIATNGITKKTKEVGNRELRGHLERKQGEVAKSYNPNGPMLGLRRGRFGVPVPTGRLASRIQSGSIMPTERGRRLAIAKGDKWKSDRNDEAAALVGRSYEMAMSNGYTDGNGKHHEAGVGAAKQSLVDIAGNGGTTDADKRASQAAIKQFLDTNSWIELQHATITNSKDASNIGKRIFEMPTWETTLTTSPQHYGSVIGKRPDLVPHMLQYTYSDKRMDELGITDPGTRDNLRGKRLSHTDRMRMAITDQMGDNDFGSVAQGFYQEIARLNDPKVSADLRLRLEEIESHGLAGQNILSHLDSGSLRADVNAALAKEGAGARDIHSFIHNTPGATTTAGGPAPATNTAAAAGAPAAAASPGATPAGGGTPPATASTAGTPAAGAGGAGGGTGAGGGAAPSGVPSGLNKEQTTQAFIEAIERTGLGGRPAQTDSAKAARESAPGSATAEPPQQTVVKMDDGGTLRIPHLPGDVISPGGVIAPQERRTRPTDEDDQNT